MDDGRFGNSYLYLLKIGFTSTQGKLAVFFEQLSLVITYAGIVLGVFVTLLLNNRTARASRQSPRRANLFLSILLLAMSFSILHVTFAGRVINYFSIKSHALGDPSFFLIAPLLWLYTQALTSQSPKPSFRLVLHFIPFGIAIFFSLLLKLFPADAPFIQFLDHHGSMRFSVFWLGLLIQFSSYLWSIHRRWLAYRTVIEQEVSNVENVSIDWVRFFMGIFWGITLFFLLVLLNLIHHGPTHWLDRAIAVIFSLSIFALGYKGILQKEIFRNDRPTIAELTVLSPSAGKKPEPQYLDRLLRYMDEDKPYLDPELTLSSLATQLKLSRSLLSQLINEGTGDNFYNFVNRYRVEQVKQFMNDPSLKHFSILGLALEAGFKSKSTFNLIFKRFTGLTPTEYLQTISNE